MSVNYIESGLDIIKTFREDSIEIALKKYKTNLPHSEIFCDLLKDENHDLADHIKNVLQFMCDILYKNVEDILEDPINIGNESQSRMYLNDLNNLVGNLEERDKYFLLYTTLYHDIGKLITKSRHDTEGAEIIKDSGPKDRKLFSQLGFYRSDIYLMSDLIRFHTHFASIGTGEASYLIFAEVLFPVSNVSLSKLDCAEKFLDYLLLLNLADMAGTIGKLSEEDFTVLMHDYSNIKEIYSNLIGEVKGEVLYTKYTDITSKLFTLSEDHTHERIRRLLRSGLKDFVNPNAKPDLEHYRNWISNYKEGSDVPPQSWFLRNYGNGLNDIGPVNSCLRSINVKSEFYTKFAYICKLDYFLKFLRHLFDIMIETEINKTDDNNKKSPHDLRRDFSMNLLLLIDMLVEEYGDFTSNNTKIGLSFDRFDGVYGKDKILRRLTGFDGAFKEAEACTKLRNLLVLWIITP